MEWVNISWAWNVLDNCDFTVEVTVPRISQPLNKRKYIYLYPDKGYFIAVDTSPYGTKADEVLAGPFEDLDTAKVTLLMLGVD